MFHTVRLPHDQGKAVLMGVQNVKKALAQLAFLSERNRARFGGGDENLAARAQALATRIKDALDPGRRMNPGVLGFS